MSYAMPNVDQVKSLAKTGLTALGPLLVAHGYVTQDMLGPDIDITVSFIGGLMTFAGMVWGLISSMRKNKIAAVEKIPGVAAVVVTSQKIADAGGPKVVTPDDVKQGAIPELPMTDSRL